MTVRTASQTGMPKVIDTAKRLGVGDFPNYLAIALGAGDTTVLRLANAYAILANQGRSVRPTSIDYVQDRNGKVIYRPDNRCAVMGNCDAPDWDGKAMPRPPNRTRQLLDPMAAFQMVHIMEGVIQRGTATVLRDLNRPMFGKTGTTSGPTNVWFVGGTPDVVAGVYLGYDHPRPMGNYAQGGRIAAPIFKQWAQTAYKDQPKVPFVAPDGIRWVRIDRASGKRVYGVFPTADDPKAQVIWEAFQPQTEPRRTYRSALGDPYNHDQQQAQWQELLRQRQLAAQRSALAPPGSARPPARAAPPPQPYGLPTQNSL
jgi:penicillin-binding protein 1A